MTRNSIRQGWAAAMMAFAVSATMAGTASASATYSYHKTGSAPGDLPVSIEMTFDHPAGPIGGSAFAGGFAGLIAFVFKMGTVVVSLDDLKAFQAYCAANGPACAPHQLDYDLMPEEGSLRFNNNQYNFAFDYGDGWLEGSFNTDFPGPADCRISNRCFYQGLWQPIPEPMTLGLLAMGVAGLAWRRGRRGAGAGARPSLAS